MIDIDDFKLINDQYGHETGDRVLQKISTTAQSLIGKTGYVVRWGGDEFLVLCPYTDRADFQMKLYCAVDVSVSVGMAIYPDQGANLEELIEVADRNMYRAKRGQKVH